MATDYGYSPSTGKYFTRGPDGRAMPVDAAAVPAAYRAKWEKAAPQAEDAPDFFARLNERAGKAAENAGNIIGDRTGSIAGTVARTVVPGSNIQAGIDAAMLLPLGDLVKGGELAGKAIEYAPEALRPAARLATRLVKPIAGGAAGGATEGHPVLGAAQGGAEGIGGEAIAGITGAGRRLIGQMDATRIGGWLSKTLGVPEIRNVGDLDQAFRGGMLRRQVGAQVEQTNAEISKKLGSQKIAIELPKAVGDQLGGISLGGKNPVKLQYSLDEINNTIREIEDKGYTLEGDPSTRMQGKALRSAAHQMVSDTADALNQMQPEKKFLGRPLKSEEKLGTQWEQARRRYSFASTLTRMFQEPGVIDENGTLAIPKIQQLAADAGQTGYRGDLTRSGGKDVADSFLKTVYRGAKPLARDVSGHGPAGRAFVGESLEPRFSLHAPKFSRHVGDLPYDLGRGRALSAAMVLGPERFGQAVLDSLGVNDTAEPEETPEVRNVIGKSRR